MSLFFEVIMSRLIVNISVLAFFLATPAISAELLNSDDFGDLRGAYPSDWDLNDNGDPLDFEFGARYFYSIGSSKMTINGGDYLSNDKSQILELYGRIDDNSTATYLKAWGGYSAVIDGSYSTPVTGGDVNMAGGQIAYVGADFGYVPFGNGDFQMGGFVGYQYYNDSPDMGRASYVTSAGGADSEVNNIEINELRLGAAINADLGDKIDLNIEAAVIPYAAISGTYGAFSLPNFVDGATTYEQGSAGTLSGSLYGASAEAMLGLHATDNLTIRVGGRVNYLTGNGAKIEYIAREVGNPTNEQQFTSNISGLEFLRYGALLEVTGRF